MFYMIIIWANEGLSEWSASHWHSGTGKLSDRTIHVKYKVYPQGQQIEYSNVHINKPCCEMWQKLIKSYNTMIVQIVSSKWFH